MTPQPSTIAAIRFGYGLHPDQPAPDGSEGLLRALREGAESGPAFARRPIAERAQMIAEIRQTERRGAALSGDARREVEDVRKAQTDAMKAAFFEDAHARIAQSVLSPHGFYERLATFWGNHFTIAMRERFSFVVTAHYHARAIRGHVVGPFRDLLIAAVTHPAMLRYLNQVRSVGPNSRLGLERGQGLNENLAREILELHTLGVDGGYTQRDVTEFARLLTGLSIQGKDLSFAFRPGFAEPGVKTVLGQRYGTRGRPHDLTDILRALDDLAQHPATRRHLSTKLARHFVADDPPADVVGALEAAFAARGDLGDVYRALVEHPTPWRRFGEKAKSPYDFLISALRAAGVREQALGKPRLRDRNRLTVGSLFLLGQPLWRAPGPDGWPDRAEDWITPQGLGARLEWASRAGKRLSNRGGRRSDPRRFLDVALADAARPITRDVVEGAAERWEGFALILASPEFNRR